MNTFNENQTLDGYGWIVTPSGIVKVKILKETTDMVAISLGAPSFEVLEIPKKNFYTNADDASKMFDKLGGNLF